jgi:hypothetical protein
MHAFGSIKTSFSRRFAFTLIILLQCALLFLSLDSFAASIDVEVRLSETSAPKTEGESANRYSEQDDIYLARSTRRVSTVIRRCFHSLVMRVTYFKPPTLPDLKQRFIGIVSSFFSPTLPATFRRLPLII